MKICRHGNSQIANRPVFVIEGRKLLSDEGICKIKYVARVTDPQEYDASLIDVLAAAIAFEASIILPPPTAKIKPNLWSLQS